ncbi:MAG: GH3 auxin-responsive promoter family protein, partial [Bacteroidota bacterium]
VALHPFKIVVSGRIKHFISAFGEHVIAKEVEEAMKVGIEKTNALVNEFTVAPQTNPKEEGALPFHEWFIEFERLPDDMERFADLLDKTLQEQNSYYFDLIDGKILQRLKITPIRIGGFKAYMKSIGKLGGQNKVQRLANDRKLAERLTAYGTIA